MIISESHGRRRQRACGRRLQRGTNREELLALVLTSAVAG